MHKIKYFKIILIALIFISCSNDRQKFRGEWELINIKMSSRMSFLGLEVYDNSLLKVSDYMLNPFFNSSDFEMENSEITLYHRDTTLAMEYFINRETFVMYNEGVYYFYRKLDSIIKNKADSIVFKSSTPRIETFEMYIARNGKYEYLLPIENKYREGTISNKHVDYLFEKVNKIELPIKKQKSNSPLGHASYRLELFENQKMIQSMHLTIEDLDGPYARWGVNILQGTPNWINNATLSE